MKKLGILDSEWYFLGKEDGSWEYTCENPLGEQKEVDDEDVIQVLDEYYDLAGESNIALDRNDEEEVQIIRNWLGWS